jgi:hypothetical protein
MFDQLRDVASRAENLWRVLNAGSNDLGVRVLTQELHGSLFELQSLIDSPPASFMSIVAALRTVAKASKDAQPEALHEATTALWEAIESFRVEESLPTEPELAKPSTGNGEVALRDLPDDAMMNHSDLAAALKLQAEPLRKRLDRWRSKNGDGWQQLTEAKAKEPRYLYRVASVRDLLAEAIEAK